MVLLVFCHPQLSQDEATTFYDELNHHIFELVSSSDVNEKKGGILAIGKLLDMPEFTVYFPLDFPKFCKFAMVSLLCKCHVKNIRY